MPHLPGASLRRQALRHPLTGIILVGGGEVDYYFTIMNDRQTDNW